MQEQLLQLLRQRNGFYCFESALHVFPSGGGSSSLEDWNSRSLWRHAYSELAEGYEFFAEDVFGNQFCLADEKVQLFDAETGAISVIASSLEHWACELLVDYDYLTGFPLAHQWQEANGPLIPGHRLLPKTPFVLGGKFELENLYSLDAVSGMCLRGELANQLRDLPEGTEVDFKVGL